MSANDTQVAGSHYQDTQGEVKCVCPNCGRKFTKRLQHWDLVQIFNWDYFQGQITRYLMRWRNKNGVEDLRKLRHYADKYMEMNEDGRE